MKKRIRNTSVSKVVETDRTLLCPICQVTCNKTVVDDRHDLSCDEHGIMKTANVLSDAYMTVVYPEWKEKR